MPRFADAYGPSVRGSDTEWNGSALYQFEDIYRLPRPDLATRSPAPAPAATASVAELDVVFRPTRRDRAVIGLLPEREQAR